MKKIGFLVALLLILVNCSKDKDINVNSEITVKNLKFDIIPQKENLIVYELDKTLNITGNVEKSINLKNNKIWYRTRITESSNNQKDGIENTNNVYQEYTLPANNEFSLNVKTKSYGEYNYNIQFKDEFGKESEIYEFTIQVKNKVFSIKQIDGVLTNIYQGQDATFISSVEKEESGNQSNNSNEDKYKIKFLEFDPQDIELEKSSISLNGKAMKLNVEEEFKAINNSIVVNSFHYGDVKLVYEVWNTQNPSAKQVKETTINIKRATITADLRIDKTKIITETPFTIQGKVNSLSRGGKIFYKSWVEKKGMIVSFPVPHFVYEKSNNITSTNEIWQEKTLVDNDFSITEKPNKEVGIYVYHLLFRDEFGNESQKITYEIQVVPPIVVHKAQIDISRVKDGSENGNFYLTIKAESLSVDAKLTRAVINLNKKTYSIERFGKNYSVTIRGWLMNEDSWDLYNSIQAERKYVACDYKARLSIEWNINETDKTKFNSIKGELINKFRDDYFDMTVWNDKGQSITQKVPIIDLGQLL
jgi:hypothetical protein